MSIAMSRKAFDDRRTSGVNRLVLLVLADMANKDGVCWPGYGYIAKKAGTTRRSAIRAVDWLEQHGYLVVTRRPGPDRHFGSNVYRLTIPETEQEDDPPWGLTAAHQDGGFSPGADPAPGSHRPTPGPVAAPQPVSDGTALLSPGHQGSLTVRPQGSLTVKPTAVGGLSLS